MRCERLKLVAASALLCALAACGGGSGSGGTAVGSAATPSANLLKEGKPSGGPPGLVGNEHACEALRGREDRGEHGNRGDRDERGDRGERRDNAATACGVAPPTIAPTGLTIGYATKAFNFTWTPVAATNITRYELLQDLDGAGPLAPVAVATSTGPAVTLNLGLLHELLNAQYAVRACNASGCGPASAMVQPDVTRAVGTLHAGNPGAFDNFGATVAVSADGSTMAVGATSEDSASAANPADDSLSGSGAVYVYTRQAGAWVQQAFLKSSHPAADARFGSALALSADGSTLAVGSSADPVQGFQSGSVDVFVRSGSTWASQAYVLPSNPGKLHQFGSALSLSSDGNTLAVGAPTENNPAAGTLPPNPVGATSPVGAAYVFTRAGTAWTEQAHILDPQPALGDSFGTSVALNADATTLAIGARGKHVASTATFGGTGAVFVYQRTASAWTQQAQLIASNPTVAALFGASVSLSSDGNTLAASAPGERSGATGVNGNQNDLSLFDAGAVYVFTRSGTAWTQQAYLKPHSIDNSDGFGAVSLSGDGRTLAVGDPGEDGSARWFGSTTTPADNATLNSGAVYVFQLGSAGWAETGYLKPGADNRVFALFGSVALSRDGSVLAIGASGESSATLSQAGAAYIF